MKVTLSNPQNTLPWPGVPGRFVTAEEVVEIDPDHPFWRQCLADGTLIAAPKTAAPQSRTAAKE
ncbi:MAG: hypothetical protein IOC54_17460 [Methylobacterium sp.]|nr:hypothetical protein [Methylobacterium sp.]MCA3653597.1 hypothetical protein [Methylobacterium sp.]